MKPLGGGDGQAVEDIVSRVATRAQEICEIAVREWQREAAWLLEAHKSLGGSIAGLKQRLGKAAAPETSRFWPGQAVVVRWQAEGGEGQSSTATVATVHDDDTMDLWCASDGGQGLLWRGTPPGDVSVR